MFGYGKGEVRCEVGEGKVVWGKATDDPTDNLTIVGQSLGMDPVLENKARMNDPGRRTNMPGKGGEGRGGEGMGGDGKGKGRGLTKIGALKNSGPYLTP